MDPTFQAHAIPQNVTNFEFHLVGDMTIKQFGYLALGLGIAFVTFIGLASPFPFVAYPIIIISAATGAAFAFIPIQERPLDHWVAAFFKAIFHPTKLSYESKVLRKEDPFFSKRLGFYIKTKHAGEHTLTTLAANNLNAPVSPAVGQRKQSMADRLLAGRSTEDGRSDSAEATTDKQTADTGGQKTENGIKAPAAAQIALQPQLLGTMPSVGGLSSQNAPKEPPKAEDLKKTVDLAKEAQETQSKILKIEKQLEQIKVTVAQPGADAKYYVDQFQSLLTDLQKLNEHSSGTARDLAVLANVPSTPTPMPVPVAVPAPQPKTAEQLKNIPSVKLTSFQNVINGVVIDSQGNYVEGAIVVAHDKQGLPVRALRSNKLGQFVAATPLSNGSYTIIVEKDNLAFDQVAIDLKNEILPPILMAARKQLPT